VRYIRASLGRYAIRNTAEEVVLWAPSLLLGSPEPGNEVLISDCSISYLFSRRDAIRALSSVVVPGRAVSLTDRIPLEAPELEPVDCSPEGLENSVKYLLELLRESAEAAPRFPGFTRQLLSRFLSPTRLVLGDTRGFERGVGTGIASSLARDIVARLAEFLGSGVSEVVKVLYVIDLRKPQALLVVGDMLVRNYVVSSELSRDREALRKIAQLTKS
jgi:hypothetical protein